MKTLKIKIYLIQILLLTAATSFALLGLIFSKQDLLLWPAPWGFINPGENQYPILLGVVSFTHIFVFLTFIMLYLSFEFYGLKNALYSVFVITLAWVGTYSLFWGLNKVIFTYHRALFDRQMLSFFILSKREFAAMALAFCGGLSILFLLAALLKKITRSYFMFFRYTIAALVGFAVFVGIETYITSFLDYTPESMLVMAVTPAAQFALAIILALIPLYLLRMILGLFRGRGIKEETPPKTKKATFKTVDPAEEVTPLDSRVEMTKDKLQQQSMSSL